MKRLAVAACGAFIGLAIAAGVGACDYFSCDTIDRPLVSGTYTLFGRPDYSLVLDVESRTAVETYRDSDDVRIEYSLGPDMPLR